MDDTETTVDNEKVLSKSSDGEIGKPMNSPVATYAYTAMQKTIYEGIALWGHQLWQGCHGQVVYSALEGACSIGLPLKHNRECASENDSSVVIVH